MGRCEAFAKNNPPWPSLLDGMFAAFGYSLVLMAIALVREPLGFGTVLGFRIMPAWFTPWTVMIMAPGAFFTLGLLVWAVRAWFPQEEEGAPK